jgi:N4-gp56 family major capsid protein
MPYQNPHLYNDPAGYRTGTATPSTIGPQLVDFMFIKKALAEQAKEIVFSNMSSTIEIPKHTGTAIKRYVDVLMLDDKNINDQGIDAAGQTGALSKNPNGNLYGSSRDIGVIADRLPALGEQGGRVNRVGFKRLTIQGTMQKYGFFYEFTQDALNFDTQADLLQNMSREAVRGATQLQEAMLQKDLLDNCGTVYVPGTGFADWDTDTATSLKASVDDTAIPTYKDFMKFKLMLDDLRVPGSTSMFTGTRYIDTKTIPSARFAFISNALLPMLEQVKDFNNQPAWVPVEQYAAGGYTHPKEVGKIGNFRFVVVPEALYWGGAGAAPGQNSIHRATNNKLDVYPILVIGEDAFTTIGFQTNGRDGKIKVMTKMPGLETASFDDPYGSRGFTSMQWWYGFLAQRPERLACMYTVAEL